MADKGAKDSDQKPVGVRESIEARATSEGRADNAKEESQPITSKNPADNTAEKDADHDVDADGDIDMDAVPSSQPGGADAATLSTKDANTNSSKSKSPGANGSNNAGSNPNRGTGSKAGDRGSTDAEADGTSGTPVPNRLDNDMLNVIENVANYLSTYKEAE